MEWKDAEYQPWISDYGWSKCFASTWKILKQVTCIFRWILILTDKTCMFDSTIYINIKYEASICLQFLEQLKLGKDFVFHWMLDLLCSQPIQNCMVIMIWICDIVLTSYKELNLEYPEAITRTCNTLRAVQSRFECST